MNYIMTSLITFYTYVDEEKSDFPCRILQFIGSVHIFFIFLPVSLPLPTALMLFSLTAAMRGEQSIKMRFRLAEDEGLHLLKELHTVVAQVHVHEGFF